MAKRAFPVEYAILGLLNDGPLHGYALRKRVDAALSPFWAIATSQIYSALHSIQDKDLVNVEVQTQDDRPPRKVYLITPSGRGEFKQWCAKPVRHLRDMRVEFLAKLYFLRRTASNEVIPLINNQTTFLGQLRMRVLQHRDLPTDDPTLADLASRFRVHQMTAAIEWLKECKQILSHEAGGDTDETQST